MGLAIQLQVVNLKAMDLRMGEILEVMILGEEVQGMTTPMPNLPTKLQILPHQTTFEKHWKERRERMAILSTFQE